MTDTPVTPPTAPGAAHDPATVTIGFLSILHDAGGALGGYLVTNSWGRPLEFRLTSAVQPNRVQIALYGPTLTEYLHSDLIGKSLVEKTSLKPDLIVTDGLSTLKLRSRVDVPVIAVRQPGEAISADAVSFPTERASQPLHLDGRFAADADAIAAILDRVDPAVDLAEPFARIREAVAEARKTGVTNRAA